MNTQLNAALLDLVNEYKSACFHIDTLLANIDSGKSILSNALFSCASFESRAGTKSQRARLYHERAKQFTWDKIITAISTHDGHAALYNQYDYTSGTYYDFDIKAAVMSPFVLKDAYKGRVDYYASRKDALAEITPYNIERLVRLMGVNAVSDAHHVWSFLNKCGATYKADIKEFTKRMTWRATADGYAWKFGIINMYRIFCQHTGRAWAWPELIKKLNDDQHAISSGAVYEGVADMCTVEKNGNGNSTLIFTADAIRVFNAFNGGIGYKEAYTAIIATTNEII